MVCLETKNVTTNAPDLFFSRAPELVSKSYEVVTNVVKTRDKDTMHVCDVRLK
jgi:hypothetical protein